MTDEAPQVTCRGHGCTSVNLINAHIIPAGFARLVRGDEHNIKVTPTTSAPARQQLGEYDDGILCAACDGKLGTYDGYAIEVLSFFKKNHVVRGPVVEVPNVRGDDLAKFVLAVIWRASISSRASCSKFDLGRYETLARDVLFGVAPLASFRDFRAFFTRYYSGGLDVERHYLWISRLRLTGCNAYAFSVSGFRVTAVIDPRPLPRYVRDYAVAGSSVLRAHTVALEETTEFKKMSEMAVAANAREKGKRPRGSS